MKILPYAVSTESEAVQTNDVPTYPKKKLWASFKDWRNGLLLKRRPSPFPHPNDFNNLPSPFSSAANVSIAPDQIMPSCDLSAFISSQVQPEQFSPPRSSSARSDSL